MPLPPLPSHRLEVLEVDELPPRPTPSFVRLKRYALRANLESAEGPSERFSYFMAHRDKLDAVVAVAYYLDAGGTPRVYLRSALRPPAALRPPELSPIPEPEGVGNMWEVVAGLVEPDERSEAGLRLCASRELDEELGFAVSPDAIETLGPSVFPSPGIVGERQYFFVTQVDPKTRRTPSEDGSVLERHARIADVTLADALEACRLGQVEDAKTELALRRLAERV